MSRMLHVINCIDNSKNFLILKNNVKNTNLLLGIMRKKILTCHDFLLTYATNIHFVYFLRWPYLPTDSVQCQTISLIKFQPSHVAVEFLEMWVRFVGKMKTGFVLFVFLRWHSLFKQEKARLKKSQQIWCRCHPIMKQKQNHAIQVIWNMMFAHFWKSLSAWQALKSRQTSDYDLV